MGSNHPRALRRRSLVPIGLSLGLIVVGGALARRLPAEPYLVADLETTIVPGSSSPELFHRVAGGVVFLTLDDRGSRDLWTTDGTAAGTRRLVVLDAGPVEQSITDFGVAGGRWTLVVGAELWQTDGTDQGTVLLGALSSPFARDAVAWVEELGLWFLAAAEPGDGHGRELWSSDGTPAGTRLVLDLTPGPESSFPGSITAVGPWALFLRGTTDGTELWRSDGTAAGTERVFEAAQIAGPLAPFAGQVVFFARDSAEWRLWRSDGTEGGTFAIATLSPERSDFGDFEWTHVATRDSDFVFLADDGESGFQVWKSDGTSAGTHRLSSVPGGLAPHCGFYDSEWVRSGPAVFRPLAEVEGDCELWRSDGTEAGTASASDLCPGGCEDPAFVTPVGEEGAVFFSWSGSGGYRLWSTGVESGTPKEIISTGCSPFGCSPNRIMELDGRVVVEHSFGGGTRLFATDGTEAGTHALAGNPEASGQDKPGGAVVDGVLVFGYDGVSGHEPWRTDGTPEGTSVLLDIAEATTASASPDILAANGEQVLFAAFTAGPGETGLWVSDGTASGTHELPELSDTSAGAIRPFRDGFLFTVGSSAEGVSGLWFSNGETTVQLADGDDSGGSAAALVAGDRFYYSAHLGAWVTDGTVEGTTRLTDGELAVESETRRIFGELGDAVYFLATGTGGNGLWRTSGTPAGTELAVEIPGLKPGDGGLFTPFGNQLAFVAETLEHGREVWVSDGTVAGTYMLGDLTPGPASSRPQHLVAIGDLLFFDTGAFTGPQTLWRTDGTTGGTIALREILIESVYVAGNLLYVVGRSNESPSRGLFRSDGTPAGTFRLSDVRFERAPAIAVGDLLFYRPGEPEPPFDSLWRTDGTVAGTFRLRGFAGDPFPVGVPVDALAVGRRLMFAMSTGLDTTALWQTDGTINGTHPVPASPSLRVRTGFRRAGSHVFFPGEDEPHGIELWALPVADVVEADPHALGLGTAARFEVEVDWADYEGNAGRGTKAPLRVDDSGLFWFFGESNWELLVKVLDACEFDGHHWVFASAASSVGYTLRVTDTATGEVRTYSNPVGLAAPPIVDTGAFSCRPATTAAERRAEPPPPKVDDACPPGVLCLGDGRFRVSTSWRRADGLTGAGKPVPGTSESGLFWFYDDDNWEALVKVLDGCKITGHYWVFAAAVTTVELTLRVEDTITGEVAEYHNPLGQPAVAITDTAALEICP